MQNTELLQGPETNSTEQNDDDIVKAILCAELGTNSTAEPGTNSTEPEDGSAEATAETTTTAGPTVTPAGQAEASSSAEPTVTPAGQAEASSSDKTMSEPTSSVTPQTTVAQTTPDAGVGAGGPLVWLNVCMILAVLLNYLIELLDFIELNCCLNSE